MNKKISSTIIDNVVLIFSIFLISFLWVRYNEHNSFLIILYSSLITFILCAGLHLISRKKQKNQELKSKEAKTIDNLMTYLIFSSKQQVLSIFKKTIEQRNIACKKQSDFLIFNNIALRPIYSKQEIDDEKIIETIVKLKSQKISTNKIIITAKDFATEAKKLTEKLTEYDLVLLDDKQTYITFFKPINFEIENKNDKTKKITFKEKLSKISYVAFNKNRFKNYLFSALILFIGSFFMRYNLYYLISATLLIFLALFSFFNKPFNKKKSNLFEPSKIEEKE